MRNNILYLEYLWDKFVERMRTKHGAALLCRSQRLSTGRGKKSVWEIWVKKEGGQRTTFVVNSCVVFQHAEKILDYEQWRNVLETYCLAGRKQVIRGEELKLGAHLGHLRAVTIERNHSKKKIDFLATSRQPKVIRDGKLVPERKIFYTDDFYPMIQYIRKGMLRNQKNYRFVVAKGNRTGKGFAGELFASVRIDPELLNIYPKKSL